MRDRDLPPELPVESKKYHPGYIAMMKSVGERAGHTEVVKLLANTEARQREGKIQELDDEGNPIATEPAGSGGNPVGCY